MSPTAAASQATEAAAEILRYVQEGSVPDVTRVTPFGDGNPVAKLVDALVGACEIERAFMAGHAALKDHHDALIELITAGRRYTDGWAG